MIDVEYCEAEQDHHRRQLNDAQMGLNIANFNYGIEPTPMREIEVLKASIACVHTSLMAIKRACWYRQHDTMLRTLTEMYVVLRRKQRGIQ